MSKRGWLGAVLTGLVSLLGAQEPANAPLPLSGVAGAMNAPAALTTTTIGQAAADMLPGNGTRGGYLLRYAPVIPNSESVYVDGKRLTRGTDYWIDYASGTLAFATPIRRFSSIQVYYRYDPQGQRGGTIHALPLLTLSLGQQGSLSVLFTPDRAEISPHGTAYRLSAYGIQNALRLGSHTTLDGYFFVGMRQRMAGGDLLTSLANQAPPAEPSTPTSEQSQFIHQTLQMQAGGLRLKATYQDIGRGFSAQKMLGAQPGLDPNQLALWEKQKGLKRLDYAVGLSLFRNAGVELSHLRIGDGRHGIEQRALKFQSQRLNLNWSRRHAAAEFQRYNDLPDPDAPHWQRERGITREALMGSLAFAPNGVFNFSELTLTEGTARIERFTYGLELPWLKVNRLEQEVDTDFKRFGDLGDAEKGDWAREAGLKREATTVQLTPGTMKLTASETQLRSPTGEMEWQRLQIETPSLKVEHLHRAVDPEFGRLQSLAPQELQQMAQETRQFHDPANNQPLKPEEVQQSLKEAGLERTFQRAEIQPTKDLTLQVKRFEIADRGGQGSVEGVLYQLKTPNLQVRIAERDISPQFNRLHDLAPVEQHLFRNEQGIRRSDWDAALITPRLGLAVAQTQAQAIGAKLHRWTSRLIHPQLELIYTRRRVDADFARAQDLADPERDLFAQLRGFDQHDWSLRLKPGRGLQLEAFLFNAHNPTERISNRRQRTRFVWQPWRHFTFGRLHEAYRSQQLADSLYRDEYERNDLQYTLGFGQLNAYQERRQIGGTLANPLYQYTDYYRFQSRELRGFSFAVEERNTRAVGAVSERFRLYQTGYTLSNRVKLTFAHAEAQREGAPDESGQQIGLEYQLRPGTTLSFSESRNAREGTNGTRTLSAGLTQTAWGVLSIGGTYQEWRIDRTQTKAQSQVVIQSARPFDFLMLKGLQFDFRYGALADRGLWQQENKHFTMQATAFGHAVKGGYVGVYVPGQGRAIDRYYQIESPANTSSPLRYTLLYKVRTYQDGRLFLIRQYHLAYKLSQKLSIVHDFQTHPEQGNPNVVLGSILQPTGFSNWALEWTLKPQVALRGDYRIEWNEQQNRRVRRGGLSLMGNQSDGVNYAVGYRVDSEMFGGRKTTAHTFYLSTERKLNADHYLMLGIQWTHYEHRADPSIRRDQPRFVLELKRVF
ncbi:MAG: hypothetical protein ABDI19_05260 [Armatimonadota bacterium]